MASVFGPTLLSSEIFLNVGESKFIAGVSWSVVECHLREWQKNGKFAILRVPRVLCVTPSPLSRLTGSK